MRAKVTADGLFLVCQTGSNKGRCSLSYLLDKEDKNKCQLLTLLIQENNPLREKLKQQLSNEEQTKFGLQDLLATENSASPPSPRR